MIKTFQKVKIIWSFWNINNKIIVEDIFKKKNGISFNPYKNITDQSVGFINSIIIIASTVKNRDKDK